MEITLLPETAQRLRAALGEEVELSPAAVPAALSRLAVEAPAVYSQVLTELSGSQIRLDSERELQRRHRRSLLRRAFFWWGEYESETGDRLLAKRRLAAAVPFGLAGAMLILLVVSGAVTHRSSPALVAGVPDVRSTPLARPRSREAPRRVDAARVLRPAAAQAVGRPLPVLLIPEPLTAQQPPTQTLPAAALLTPSLSNRTLPSPPGNPVVFDRQQARVLSAPAGVQGEASVTPAPVIYDRGAANASDAGENPARSSQAGSQWIPGQRVAARLATGVVVVAGGPPMPVIAESVGPGSTWLGRATLGPEGRVQVTFTLASPGGQGGVHGVALDPDHLVPGLMGRMTLRHPHAAAAVMTSALQAAGDYVQALARQGEVTLADGWAQLAVGQTAPAWTYAASRLAQVLEPRGGAAGPVETAEVEAGSHLTILVMEAP